jgi:hypothetical protein
MLKTVEDYEKLAKRAEQRLADNTRLAKRAIWMCAALVR